MILEMPQLCSKVIRTALSLLFDGAIAVVTIPIGIILGFFGWGLASVKMVAINRDVSKVALKKVAEQGIDRLKRGISVVVFPEGTRADPHCLLPFQIGGAYLASKSNVPVIPVSHNAGTIWPKGSRIRGPGVITVTIGKPIMPGLKAHALNKQLEDWMHSQIPPVNSLTP